MPRKPTKRKKTKKLVRKYKHVRYGVFVSHSSKDQFIAETIAEKIEKLGAKIWVDTRNMEGGGITIKEIIGAIAACKEVIVLVSPDSIKSQWVLFEIGVARAKNKRITPILYNTDPNDIAPMKDVAAIDLNKFDLFLTQMQERIKQQQQN